VLGGPEDALIRRLGPTGPDTVRGADDRFARCSTGADQYAAEIVSGRVRAILRQYCGAPPPQDDRVGEARTFFPADALGPVVEHLVGHF